MVSTRSRGAVVPERTDLQLQRDYIAARMNMNWLPQNDRPHLQSRGILNGRNLCYQNSVLQAFMHQFPFINWVLQHSIVFCSDTQCLKCHLKRLVQQYWGLNANAPVQYNNILKGIAHISHQSQLFGPGQQECANLFYNWIIDTLKESPDNTNWQREHDSLYCLTLQSRDRCKVCGTPYSPAMDHETFLSVGVDPAHTEVSQAIFASLHHDVNDLRCERCDSNQTKTRWTEIVAAPKILRIHLQILLHDRKIFHTLNYPDVLDLTAFQQASRLPLRYQLSSVVAHAGDYVSVENDDEEMARRLQEEIQWEEYVRMFADYFEEKSNDRDKEEESDDVAGTSDESDDSIDLEEAERLQMEEFAAMLEEDEEDENYEADGYNYDDVWDAESNEADGWDSDHLDRAMDDADPAVATATSEPCKEPKKLMRGHYIASVREPDGTFSTINDSSVQPITHADFLSNPQRSQDQQFQAYILTYIRDDSERRMPRGSKRWFKEIDRLGLNGSGEGVGVGQELGHARFPRVEEVQRRSQRLDTNEGAGDVQRGRKRRRVR